MTTKVTIAGVAYVRSRDAARVVQLHWLRLRSKLITAALSMAWFINIASLKAIRKYKNNNGACIWRNFDAKS